MISIQNLPMESNFIMASEVICTLVGDCMQLVFAKRLKIISYR
jgi:hypothetical protein